MTAPFTTPTPADRPRMPEPASEATSARPPPRAGRDRRGDRRDRGGAARRDRRRSQAEDVFVQWGGIGATRADTVGVEFGSIGAAFAGEVRVSQGYAGSIMAREATLEQGIARNVIAQRVTINRPSAMGILIAQHVHGDVRPILEWRGALAAGAVIGLGAAIGIAVRTGEREARRRGIGPIRRR